MQEDMASTLKALPLSFRKLVVQKLTPIFREAVSVITEPLAKPESGQVLVKNRFVGINASDINMTAGRYFSKGLTLPFELGFEGVGEVAGIGDGVSDLKIGQPVMYLGLNAFAEYVYLPQSKVIPILAAKPEFLPLLVSGATASLSLDKCGRIAPGDKVLITAAAGGAGHLAVQWAKNAGCHVIGLCSTKEKVEFLKSIGCDRPINYKEDDLESILKSEYPNGIDVVWETVGGDLFDKLFEHLAIKGRLVVVGAISGYKNDFSAGVKTTDLPMKLLLHSSTISGFLLSHFHDDVPHYLTLLVGLMHEKKLTVLIDNGESTLEGVFTGIDDIPRAVEHLHSGTSKGKVVVAI